MRTTECMVVDQCASGEPRLHSPSVLRIAEAAEILGRLAAGLGVH
jgi:hypothetical protein